MVEKIVTIHRATYPDKAWHFTCDHPNIMVLLDKLAIQKVLNNLLINAYKYGGDIINVSVSIVDNDAVIQITDNGEGLLFDLENVLNQPFNSQSKQSSGLGLAIVGRIVEAHHGRITLDNTFGAVTFEIKFPIV